MTTHLLRPPADTAPTDTAPTDAAPTDTARPTRARLTTRTLGLLGLGWAFTYVPIHVYWALGGLSPAIGITGQQEQFQVANAGACVVIVGAGLTCLALTQRWGAALAGGLLRGTAWVGGVLGLAHWALFTGFCALRLAGTIAYPGGGAVSTQQLRSYDWANLSYFELWFGVMGMLLIGCARRTPTRSRRTDQQRATPARRLGTGVSLAGVAVVVWGVFTFDPWVFAIWGPALLTAGLGTLVLDGRSSSGGGQS
ncbi:MAG: hypothetical protein ABI181_05480 [Mycobacteriaceae bacterium]